MNIGTLCENNLNLKSYWEVVAELAQGYSLYVEANGKKLFNLSVCLDFKVMSSAKFSKQLGFFFVQHVYLGGFKILEQRFKIYQRLKKKVRLFWAD